MENQDWKYIGKIAASIALSVILAFFWISSNKKSLKISSPKGHYRMGSILKDQLKSDKNLVIFWASWCESCKEELGAFDNLSSEGLHLLAVNLDEKEDQSEALELWEQAGMVSTQLLFDHDKKIREELNIDLLPTYFLIDSYGNLILRFEGKVNWEDRKILKLLKSDD